MTDPVVIGFGANKWVKDSNTKIISLYYRNFGGSGAYTLHESGGTTDYQVPVGKKVIILSQMLLTDTGTGSHDEDVWESNAIDSATGTNVYQFLGSNNSGNNQYEVWIEFSASKYINYKIGGSTGIFVTGIETNA